MGHSEALPALLTIILISIKLPRMYICVCKAVSDKRIHKAVAEGASSLRELTRDLGVGTCCGRCVPDARRVLGEALVAQAPLRLADLPPAAMPAFG